MTRLTRAVVLGLFAGAVHCSSISAENWTQFRGPTGFGLTTAKSNDLPLKWDGKSGENVRWKVPLKETHGHSSPIVWEDRVFITTSDRLTDKQEEAKEIPDHHVICFQKSDGKELWKARVAHGPERAGGDIYAASTPTTDGQAVYALFGSAVIAAVDFKGNVLWRHERAGPFSLNPGICSSLILYDDTVILHLDQGGGKGYLQGLDKKTGNVKWEQKREKLDVNNSTPFLIDVKGKKQLIVAGSNALKGLDPKTGEPIWTCESLGFGASPAYGSGLIYADKGGNEGAVAVDPTGAGDVTDSHVKWKLERLEGDYSSPVISGKYIYRVVNDGVLACLDVTTGKKLFTARLADLSKTSSPIATGDGRIYFVSTGKSHVIEAGPKLKLLATNDLQAGGNGATPAISDGCIFIRDFDWLYCLGKK